MIEESKLFAWLDGELDPAEAAEVEAAVAADPDLARTMEHHRAMQHRLRAAFDPIAEQQVALSAYLPASAQSPVASLAKARVAKAGRTMPGFWTQAAAMAATFAIGLMTGNMLLQNPASPVVPEGGRLVAAAALEEALYTRLASQPVEEGPKIGLTFRDRDGKICRTFTDLAASGLACREGGDWRVRALIQMPEGQGGEFRMASGETELAELVDSTIVGEPFDATQEKAAQDAGWR